MTAKPWANLQPSALGFFSQEEFTLHSWCYSIKMYTKHSRAKCYSKHATLCLQDAWGSDIKDKQALNTVKIIYHNQQNLRRKQKQTKTVGRFWLSTAKLLGQGEILKYKSHMDAS